jgi:hypothetical protein
MMTIKYGLQFFFFFELTDNDGQNFVAGIVQWPAKKVSHHLNVSVKKALITHLDFDVTKSDG